MSKTLAELKKLNDIRTAKDSLSNHHPPANLESPTSELESENESAFHDDAHLSSREKKSGLRFPKIILIIASIVCFVSLYFNIYIFKEFKNGKGESILLSRKLSAQMNSISAIKRGTEELRSELNEQLKGLEVLVKTLSKSLENSEAQLDELLASHQEIQNKMLDVENVQKNLQTRYKELSNIVNNLHQPQQ
jgi:chaperonin cofactor prefoldin